MPGTGLVLRRNATAPNAPTATRSNNTVTQPLATNPIEESIQDQAAQNFTQTVPGTPGAQECSVHHTGPAT